MSILKFVWNFLDETSGVVTSIVWAFAGAIWLITWTTGLIHNGLERFILLLIVLIFLAISVRFLVRQFSSSIKKINNERMRAQIIEDLSVLEKSKPADQIPLPSSNRLKAWRNYAGQLALEWASDAKEMHMTLFIERDDNKVDIRPQFSFFSKWKNQILTVFLSKNISTRKAEKDNLIGASFHSPFFIRYTNWDSAVKKSVEKISHLIGRRYTLMLLSHYDSFRFEFSYVQGDVQKTTFFEFDGMLLKAQDGSKIDIKTVTD